MSDTPSSTAIALQPVARAAALTRGMLWGSLAFLLATGSWMVLRSLDFSTTAISNNLVDVSLAIITAPFALLALYLVVLALRWMCLGAWPADVGVFATSEELVLRLGPFGTKRFDAARLDIRYPFELSGDEDDGGFEAFLPEEEQMSQLLPRILHPSSKEHINRAILKFARGPQSDIAAALRPVLQQWRSSFARKSD